MKRITLIVVLVAALGFAAKAELQQAKQAVQKKDSTKDIKNQPKPKAVKGRTARRRLQRRQIKYHNKQLKKVHAAQKELNTELKRKDT